MKGFNQAELEAIRAKLLARADALRTDIDRVGRESKARTEDAETDVGDQKDAAGEIALREVDSAQMERDREELLKVVAAEHRLDDGSYGVCFDCGEMIEPARLRAVPEAERCVGCQSQHEPAGEDGFAVLDAVHRQTVVEIEALAALVESMAAQGDATNEHRAGLSAVLAFFQTTARRHHEDEERHVFPPLLASGNPELVQNVLRLQQDHFWIEEDWLELEPQLLAIVHRTGNVDFETLRTSVEVMAALYHDHIALEESMIYPQARGRIGFRARREMGREMAARRRNIALDAESARR